MKRLSTVFVSAVAVLAVAFVAAGAVFAATAGGQISVIDSDESVTMTPSLVTGAPGESVTVTAILTPIRSENFRPEMVFTVPAGVSAAEFQPSSTGTCAARGPVSIACVWPAGSFSPGAVFTVMFQATIPSTGSAEYTLSRTEAPVTGFSPLTVRLVAAASVPVAAPAVVGSVAAGALLVGWGALVARRRRGLPL